MFVKRGTRQSLLLGLASPDVQNRGLQKIYPALQWALPDRVFFACGGCHILAYAFLERYGAGPCKAVWLKPAAGFTGNHIVIDGGAWIFDYHGYTGREAFFAHTQRKSRRWWPGWTASPVELPMDVLISEAKSRTYEGLWLREPSQFLHDAMPRARTYLQRFLPPPASLVGYLTM